MNKTLLLKCFLKKNNIEYFSYSLFNREKTVLTYCNNQEWLEFYNNEYNVDNKSQAPVKQYLTKSNSTLLLWDGAYFDSNTEKYLSKRNQIVGVKNNASLIYKNNNWISTLTFGTKMNQENLLNLFRNKNKELENMSKKLLYSSSTG